MKKSKNCGDYGHSYFSIIITAMNQFDTYDSGAINPQDQYDPRVAQVLRGKSFFAQIFWFVDFLDAEPLSNAEVESILEERVNYLQRSNYAVPRLWIQLFFLF